MPVSALVGLFDRSFQPHLNQMQHRSVDDSASYRLEKLGVWKAIEVATQVCINNFSIPGVNQPVDLAHRIQRATVTPIGILLGRQVRLENGFEYQHCRRLRHSVPNGRYP
jgi:hypothetical protein